MTTERIDHVAKALEEIDNADTHLGIEEFRYAGLSIGRAQVHATLALVGRQHIANRIALAVAIRGDLELGGTSAEVADWLNDGGGVLGYFSESEQEGLGVS